jgi:hypothetical protein
VLDGVDAGHLGEHLVDPVLAPTGRDERDVELAQVFADEPAV